jgi:hypothetical protein
MIINLRDSFLITPNYNFTYYSYYDVILLFTKLELQSQIFRTLNFDSTIERTLNNESVILTQLNLKGGSIELQ